MIHRDLKPANIAVNEQCDVKVIEIAFVVDTQILDFGLARPSATEGTMTGFAAMLIMTKYASRYSVAIVDVQVRANPVVSHTGDYSGMPLRREGVLVLCWCWCQWWWCQFSVDVCFVLVVVLALVMVVMLMLVCCCANVLVFVFGGGGGGGVNVVLVLVLVFGWWC